MDSCEKDPGEVHGNVTYYEKTDTAVADPDSLKSKLKAFTTNVASQFCEANRVQEHWKTVAHIHRTIGAYGGKIVAKGGLALHFSLQDLLGRYIDAETDAGNKQKLEDAKDYILNTYAATSDLDTGISVDPLHLAPVIAAAKASVEKMRADWSEKYVVLGRIVDACQQQSQAEGLAAELGVRSIDFIADEQPDQTVVMSAPSDGNCKFAECVTVVANGKHPIFISDNESLVFQKGHNVADFHLVRAKWSVSARIIRTDGSVCKTTCPAELIDVAIPRKNDSRSYLAASLGTDFMKSKADIMGVEVPIVSLKYQLMDLLHMCYEGANGGVDPKIGKRIHRYIVLKAINNIIVYQTDDDDVDVHDMSAFDAFRTVQDTDRWFDLLKIGSGRDVDAFVHDFMKAKMATELDRVLIRHLMNLRDVVLGQTKMAYHKDEFFGKGGGSDLGWGVATALAAIVLSMSFLG